MDHFENDIVQIVSANFNKYINESINQSNNLFQDEIDQRCQNENIGDPTQESEILAAEEKYLKWEQGTCMRSKYRNLCSQG